IARVAQDSLFLKLFSVFMADIYREEGQLGLALQLAKATYREILKKPGREIFDALATLIDIHLAREEYDRALHYALAFKERTGSQGATGQQLRANRYLLAIYSRQDNYAQYHAIAREYYPIRDSLQSAAVLNQLAVLNQQIADSEREKEIVLLNASLDQAATKRFWLSVLGVLIVLILSLILYFRNRQLKTQRATILREQESTKTLADLNERLKRMDVLKNRWYTNISHEFRTPLTIIAGMTDQMIKAPEVWLEKGAQLVQQNTNKLLNLVNQMLDLRKLESDELKVHLVRGDVVSFLRYLSDSFRPYAQSQGLDLHFWSTEERIPMDHDPDKLLHIFSNLLSNAIKYTPTGGDIYLQLDRRKDQGQEQLEISVRDTGPGIAASEIPLVFDRFYQVDDAASRSGTGTGIGLHLTRGLVQLLGGQIGLRSEVGKGSTFRVHLPITLRAEVYGRSIGVSPPTIPFGPIAPGYPPSPSPAPSSDRPHLLIVEDQADVVTYLTSILEADYQLSIAEDGERGIEMALADVPDLIVSDVMMPRKDGYELCTTLKEDLRTSHIPIVLLTAKADSESRISGLQRGADAYLSKPFAPQELLVRLQQLLHLRRTLQERYAAIGSVERKAEAVASREEVFLQRMRALVEAHLSDPDLNMPRVCKALEMSRSQVYKKIKALTGRTPSQYIRSIRLHHARRLLQSSDLNVSEVAYEVGFSSPFYFSNVFLAEFGVRPNETRK
ncbi:MAG: ATP-binding protein, partial [Bacteroidota bacterium]